MMTGMVAKLKSLFWTIYYLIIDTFNGNKCTKKNCDCDFYDDTATFQALNSQANDPLYAKRMLDARVIGRPLNCDRCTHPREAHERLEARRMMPEFMPNGGVIAIEMAARKKLAKRTARFPQASITLSSKDKIQVVEIKVGNGNEVVFGSDVLTRYCAKFNSDQVEFESNNEFKFKVGKSQIIAGLDEGVRGMMVGGVRKIIIPPQLAYGCEKSIDGRIGETLVFEIELLASVMQS